MKSFDLEEFKTNAMSYGFIRPAFFLVAIAAPAWYGTDTKFLTYLCSGAALPGSQIMTSGQRIVGYGKPQEIPYDVNHTTVNFTFYSDGNAEVNSLFEQWLRNVISYGVDGNENVKGAIRGETHYPSHYETTIEIYQFNEQTTGSPEIIRYVLYGAYPTNIAEQQLDWSNGDAVSMITVGFAYRDYKIFKNDARSYNGVPGTGNQSIQINGSFYDELLQEGFAAEFANRRSLADQAESITSGILDLGFEAISSALGAISNVSSVIQDKINVVNNIGTQLNSMTNSVSTVLPTSLSNSIPTVPAIPAILFP